MLAGTETVEHRAAFEAALTQLWVDAAAKVILQVHAFFARILLECEVSRFRECQSDAAQADAPGAVGLQAIGTEQLPPVTRRYDRLGIHPRSSAIVVDFQCVRPVGVAPSIVRQQGA
ncbi:MAG TPA: hypothetical protein VN045_08540, partial [Microbacteriaceae bacterium]|nr:hypothetical protein [Microbacteriaceae bacterium]